MPPRRHTSHPHQSTTNISSSTNSAATLNVITRHRAKVNPQAHQDYISFSSGIDGTLQPESSSSSAISITPALKTPVSPASVSRTTRKRRAEEATPKSPKSNKQSKSSRTSTSKALSQTASIVTTAPSPAANTRASVKSHRPSFKTQTKSITSYLRPSKMSTAQKRSSQVCKNLVNTDQSGASSSAHDPHLSEHGASEGAETSNVSAKGQTSGDRTTSSEPKSPAVNDSDLLMAMDVDILKDPALEDCTDNEHIEALEAENSQSDDDDIEDRADNIVDEAHDDVDVDEDEDDEEDEEDDEDEDDEYDAHGGHIDHEGLFSSGGMSGIVMGTSSRLKSILANLRAYEDPSLQLIALQDLAFLLSVSTEDSLAGYISCDSFVKELVNLMRGSGDGDDNPDTMLLACRCLSNLMEAMPAALGSVVYGGAVPVLCAKLIEIQYIDALEKISSEYPNAVVKEGGLAAVLMFLDFFSTNVQRTAVKTAANCCRGMQHDNISMVKDILPNLENLLQYSDQKIVEQACLCFVRLADSFKSNAAHLQSTITENVLRAILALLSPHASVTVGTIAEYSPVLGFALLEMDVVDTLFLVLTGSHAPNSHEQGAIKVTNIGSRSKDQVLEILGTISELLPPVPKANALFDTEYRYVPPKKPESDSAQTPVGDVEMSNSAPESGTEKRKELLASHPERVHRLGKVLIPTLIDVYSSTVHLKVRQRAIHALVKLVYFTGDEQLKSVLKDVELASFLAVILSQQEHQSLIVAALQISYILMTKLPSTYHMYFEREGVLFEISKLVCLGAELSLMKEPPVPAETKEASQQVKVEENPNMSDVDDGEKQPKTKDETAKVESTDEPSSEGTEQKLVGLVAELRSMREQRAEHQSMEEQLRAIEAELAKAWTKVASTTVSSSNSSGSSSSSSTGSGSSSGKTQPNDSSSLKPTSESSSTRHHLRILQRLMEGGSRSAMTAHKEERGLGSGKTKDWIFERAGIIVELCEEQSAITKAVGESLNGSSLPNLRRIATGLKAPEEETSVALKELASFFSEKGLAGASSFEFLNSSLPQSLLEYLAGPAIVADPEAQSQRLQAFIEAFMVSPGTDASSSPFGILVKKLQEALTRSESFEVEAAQNTRSDLQNNPSSSLATQLRLKITPEEGTEVSSPYHNLNVSIHAIATFRTLDEYLRPRLKPRLSSAEKSTSNSRPSKDGDQMMSDRASRSATEQESLTASATDTRSKNLASPPTPSDENEKTSEESKERPVEELSNTDEDDVTEDRQLEEGLKEVAPSPKDIDSDTLMTDSTRSSNGEAVKASKSSKASSGTSRSSKSSASPWHIQFSLHGTPIDTDMTVYGAIHEYERKYGKSAAQRNTWPTTYPITYRRVDTAAPEENSQTSRSQSQSQSSLSVDATFTADMPKELSQESDLALLLCLLRVLHGLNDDWSRFYGSEAKKPEGVHRLDPTVFVNSKITAKVNRQLEEPLIVASACLPKWTIGLVTGFLFLFPFETRYTYLQSTAFGFSRSIMRWQNQQQRNGQTDHRDDSQTFLGRIQRQKVRISRHKALESAVRVMQLYSSSQTMLEVEYYEEVGTGLGPTLEFYSVVSREFSKKTLQLWRDTDPDSASEYVTAPYGLFPRPLVHSKGQANETKILNLFRSLGQFIAKAMLDSRIIDVPLSGLFVSRLLGHHKEVNLSTMAMIDPVLAKSLQTLQGYVAEKKRVYALNLPSKKREKALISIELQGAKLEDMSLDFTLPGYPDIELKVGGANIPVTIYNVEEYIKLTVDMTIGQGIKAQLNAFKAGFDCVFSIQNLSGFRSDELVSLFGSGEEDWSYETLVDAIKADHGFRSESRAFKNLLSVMSEFNKEERRQFLQFITGSPKLPIGGFKNLHPPFTVVCKPYEAPLKADDYLPSVMTCANYLKMPDYSSKEVTLARFRTAFEEGQGSFHLS
ncbi:Ubiquitin fusion degradation protein 4 [Podila epigama]|nr:Ubiquitin fusion degradation protein 4 [Podila epigama]